MAQMTELSWVSEHPEKIPNATAIPVSGPVFRPRKSHTKSRNACKNCKQRRIKCDESRPQCGQCIHRRVDCDLPAIQVDPTKNPAPALLMPTDVCESDLLDHFTETQGEWMGSPEFQRLMPLHARRLVVNAPYLRHAVLAFASSHLAFLYPSETKYAIASTYHYERSLNLFSSHLRTTLQPDDVDSTIGCGHLQNMLAFGNLYKANREDELGFTWLRAMRGIPTLWAWEVLGAHMKNSMWKFVCDESHKGLHQALCMHTENDGQTSLAAYACKGLHQLCDVPLGSPLDENVYADPLSYLCQLMGFDSERDKIGIYVFFIGRLSVPFLELLVSGDPRAVLIICYWCTYFGNINQWWVSPSAKTECRYLCAYLDKIRDPQIHELLKLPASKCGYKLQAPVLVG